jgi:hypothetical protein
MIGDVTVPNSVQNIWDLSFYSVLSFGVWFQDLDFGRMIFFIIPRGKHSVADVNHRVCRDPLSFSSNNAMFRSDSSEENYS